MTNKIARIVTFAETCSYFRRRVIISIASFVAVILLAVAISITLQVNDYHRTHDAESQARERATQLLTDVLSYDFNTIDTHFQDVLPSLGGDLRGQFDSVGKEVIIPSAKQRQVVTTADVVESSIVSGSRDAVTLLMFVNQSTTSTDSTVPKLDGSRVRVAMTERDGNWVMTEMTPV
jgi:Mce-associated membrane protein